MMHGQANIDNEIYLLIKYIKRVLWRVAKRLSYIEEARCLKVKMEEQLLSLENPLLKILVLEDERSDWVNPVFY